IPVAASANAPAPAPGAGADPVALRIAAGRDLLADPSAGRFAVQLMVTDVRERGYLAAYLAEAGKALGTERLYVVPAAGAEASRVAVLYAPFPTRDEAA